VFATCSTLDQVVKLSFRFIPNEVGFKLILLNLEIHFVKNRGNREEVCSVTSLCAKWWFLLFRLTSCIKQQLDAVNLEKRIQQKFNGQVVPHRLDYHFLYSTAQG
jgi:hypothetical protein